MGTIAGLILPVAAFFTSSYNPNEEDSIIFTKFLVFTSTSTTYFGFLLIIVLITPFLVYGKLEKYKPGMFFAGVSWGYALSVLVLFMISGTIKF